MVIVLLYGLAQIGKANNFPHKSTWESHAIGWWAYVVLAVLATVASALVVLGYRSLVGQKEMNEKFVTTARGFVHVVEKNTELKHDEIGVSVWVVQGIKGFRRLERRALVIAQTSRATTPITWTKGKGAIGRCWARNESTFADFEQLRKERSSEAEWCKQQRDERFRFSWSEFNDTSRYTAVLAVPLRPRIYGVFRVKGVVAIDTTAEGKGSQLAGVSKHVEFGSIIRTCESVLSRE